MPFTASTIRSVKGRSIPLVTAILISSSAYAAHTYYHPLLADEAIPNHLSQRPKLPILAAGTYTPLAWGSNRHLTLYPDSNTSVLKRPTPIPQLGSTPLRDLVIAEKYGACVDARGDIWMWGTGYDPSGQIGKSLKGKGIATLVPAPAKLVALSKSGNLYVVPVSKAFQDAQTYKNERSWWNSLFGTDPGIDFTELKADGGLKRGEKWASVSTGTHHLLAVTNKGRTFSLPLSPAGNSHRQLGTRQVFETPFPVPSSSASAIPLSAQLPPESDVRFATVLTEIPALKGLQVAQVASSDRTSFARTPNGKVVGWGANESGQIGLGANAAVEMITVPVEIVLAKNYPGGTALSCVDIKAGGSSTFFTVERSLPGKESAVDLLACGNGMSGSLGNGMWSSACGVPTKVKTVSGLQEYSEKDNAFKALGIHNVSISPSSSPHVFAVLDTVSQADAQGVKEGLYGKDVMVWGGNVDYQLGNGKRSSLAVPQHLPALVDRYIRTATDRKEAIMSSGTLSPMPHSRLQLHQSRADAYDLDGKLIKRNVKCEEVVVAGWNASVLYNKIML